MALRGYQLQKPKDGWVERRVKQAPIRSGFFRKLVGLFSGLISGPDVPDRPKRRRERLVPAWPPAKARN